MAGLNDCPECGKPLPIDSPQGLCPRCLLNRGLESEDMDGFELVSALRAALGRPLRMDWQ